MVAAETYTQLMTNLPHLEFEVTLTLIQDVLIGVVLWPLVKWLVRRHDHNRHNIGGMVTKDQVRNWLFKNYLRRTPEAEAEVECILSQDDWKYVEALGEKFAGQAFEPGPEAANEALGFALTSLYECHDGPHLPTCPSAKR